MAGAGYKLFNTGDVLTAAQVNTYLQEQTVMVFASSAARTSALSGVLAEGMMSYLQDTNSVEVYNGTSWVNVGNAGDITEVQAGVGISVASGTGPIPVITNSSTDLITTAGDLLYGTAADTVARLGIGTAGQVLKVNSGATAPEWGAAPAAASGPAFKATGSGNQGLSASTFTKAELGTETFDTDSCYDPTTNYRFTPNKAGYYSFQTTVRITHGDASAYYQYGIYKNGTLENLLIIVTAQTSGSTYAASNLIYFNGTTDYAELYVYTQATASQNLDKGNTFFSGVWIRS